MGWYHPVLWRHGHRVREGMMCQHPRSTSNPKFLNIVGIAPHPGSSLVWYDCFHVLTAEVRPCYLGNYTLHLALHQDLQKTSCSGQQGHSRLPSLYSPHHKHRRFFLLTLEPNFQDVQGKQLQKQLWPHRQAHTYAQVVCDKEMRRRRNGFSLWSADWQVRAQPKPAFLQVGGQPWPMRILSQNTDNCFSLGNYPWLSDFCKLSRHVESTARQQTRYMTAQQQSCTSYPKQLIRLKKERKLLLSQHNASFHAIHPSTTFPHSLHWFGLQPSHNTSCFMKSEPPALVHYW